MRKEIIINSSVTQTRVAFTEDGNLVSMANINSDNQGSWQNSWTLSGERGGLDAR